jgi:hypothetical protein
MGKVKRYGCAGPYVESDQLIKINGHLAAYANLTYRYSWRPRTYRPTPFSCATFRTYSLQKAFGRCLMLHGVVFSFLLLLFWLCCGFFILNQLEHFTWYLVCWLRKDSIL